MNKHISPSKNKSFNQGISSSNRHPGSFSRRIFLNNPPLVILLSQEHRDPDRIQIKTSSPPKDFKAAVNARADAIAQQIGILLCLIFKASYI